MILETRGLKKHFDLGKGQVVHAVDGVSLGVGDNEVVGLVGESGSGKSTLGKTAVGLLEKTAGAVFYRGEKLPERYTPADFGRYATEVQMIFQDPYASLNPRMTVLEIVGEGLRLRGTAEGYRDRVADWLEKVGLHPDHMSRYPHEFSGGQRQRIGIARALIVEPRFVVCDEPISALDVSVQAQIVNLLDELKASMGLALLFIAHDLSMVRYVSDRMAVMYLGALAEVGPADAVFFNPRHPYTQVLVESNPQPDPALERARAFSPLEGEIPSPVNIGTGCRFAGRCPQAMAHCKEVTPPLVQVEAEGEQRHEVACHLYG